MIFLATLVAGVSLALRVPRMFQCVWYDEYCRTSAVLGSGTLRGVLLHDVHNPLYNAVMYAWISVFGDSDASIRVPSLLAGYSSLLLFWSLVRRRVGEWVGAGVLAWGALSPMHVWYSTEAKNNMFLLAMATLALWAVARLIDRPGPGRGWAAAASLLALFFTDLVSLLVIVPLGGWLAASAARDRRLVRHAVVVGAIVLAGAVPWGVFKYLHLHELWRDYLEPFRPREVAELLGGMFLTGHAAVPDRPGRLYASIAGMVLVAPLLTAGAAFLWRCGRGRVFVLLLGGGVGGMVLVSAIVDAVYSGRAHNIYQPRNLMCVLYVFGAVLWTGVWRLGPGVARRAAASVLVVAACAGSVLMQTVHAEKFTVERARQDWRAVARLLGGNPEGAERAGSGGVLVVSRSPAMPLERYAPGVRVVTTWGEPVTMEVLRGVSAEGAALYYLDDQGWWGVGEGEVESWGRAYTVREAGRAGRMVLYRLEAGG